MLTGTIPPYHGAHDNNSYKLDQSNVTLAEILGRNGFATGAVTSAYVLDSQFGLDQGFDYYNDSFEKPIETFNVNERRGEETSRFAVEWLDKHKSESFFLFVHYFDPHQPYEPPEPFASLFSDNLYDGEIAYTDYCIEQVINKLRELGLYDSTLIIVTADHAEMRGEHGEMTHSYFIYESVLKVPLIFKIPGRNKARNFNTPVGIIDIVPTVCSVLGIETPSHVQGKDLSTCFSGKHPIGQSRYFYCESLIPTKYDANSLLGVVADRWKYIQTTRPELYDLSEDPGETNNLIKQQPQRARILQDRLREILEKSVRKDNSGARADLDEEGRNRLESLGYIATTNVKEEFEFDQSRDDPKDFINFHVAFMSLPHLEKKKMYDQAEILCKKLISQRPRCYGVYLTMGNIAMAQNDLTSAVTHYTKALKIDPLEPDVNGKLGEALLRQGKIEQAFESWHKALQLRPDWPMVLNNLAWIKASHENARYRNPEEAVRLALRACELTDYKTPHVLNTLATAYAAAGNFPEAVRTAEKTLDLVQSSGQRELIAKAQESLDLFRAGIPYRD